MIKCSAKRLVCQAYAIAIEMQKRRRGRKIFKTEALERIFDEADAQIAKMVGELLFLSISNSEDRNSFIISVIEFLVNFAVYFFFMSFSNWKFVDNFDSFVFQIKRNAKKSYLAKRIVTFCCDFYEFFHWEDIFNLIRDFNEHSNEMELVIKILIDAVCLLEVKIEKEQNNEQKQYFIHFRQQLVMQLPSIMKRNLISKCSVNGHLMYVLSLTDLNCLNDNQVSSIFTYIPHSSTVEF